MHASWNDLVTLFSGPDTQAMYDIGVTPFLFLLGVVAASSLLVAALYVHFVAGGSTGLDVYRAFPLIGLSIAAIFIVVQFSLPLSIGLLAALSVVRFRTPIKEPEEIGCLMVIVAVATAAATFTLAFIGILLGAVAAGLWLEHAWTDRRPTVNRGIVVITLPASAYLNRAVAIRDVLSRHLAAGGLDRVSNGPDEVEVSYRFSDITAPDVHALRVDLETQASGSGVRIFLSRGRAL